MKTAELTPAPAAATIRVGPRHRLHPTFSELVFTPIGARLVGISMVALAFASIYIVFALVDLQAPVDRLPRY